jgi:putative FmdB family regulatory protein
MPILLYRCEACGKQFPKIVMKPEAAPRGCPVCGAEAVFETGEAFAGSADRDGCGACEGCGPTPKQVYSSRFPST